VFITARQTLASSNLAIWKEKYSEIAKIGSPSLFGKEGFSRISKIRDMAY